MSQITWDSIASANSSQSSESSVPPSARAFLQSLHNSLIFSGSDEIPGDSHIVIVSVKFEEQQVRIIGASL